MILTKSYKSEDAIARDVTQARETKSAIHLFL
jgi:hypothetical protein